MRTRYFVLMLVAAAVVPYALTNKDWYPKLKAQWAAWTSAAPGAPADQAWYQRMTSATKNLFAGKPAANPATGSLIPNAPTPSIVGDPVSDLAEVIRFDVTPDWIMNRWGRVSTVFSEPGLEGMRVAIVTGLNPDDLAGSLTYYYDQQHAIQRVTFRGSTGDGRRVVEFVQRVYSFKPDPSVAALQYSVRTNGKIHGVLRIANPPVIRGGQPLSRLETQLELNRPNSPFGLSRDMQQTLATDATYARH